MAAPYFKNPQGGLKTFDFVVANPPFSNKNWTSGINRANDLYNRFAFGVPPTKNGDYAFLLHILASLKSNGKGAVILPHGVLFRGNAEADIRKRIVGQGFIKGIIGLPANLFYGTGIPACIKERIKVIKHDKDTNEEGKALEAYLDLIEQEAVASNKVKDAQMTLDTKLVTQYGQLSEAEIKSIVVDDKWLAQLAAAVQSELDRVSQALTGRIKQLTERYAVPLPQLVDELETLAARVDGHFRKMGFIWD